MKRTPHGGVPKNIREQNRALKRLAKAERLAFRRAAKFSSVEIDNLPPEWQGIARTLANGEPGR